MISITKGLAPGEVVVVDGVDKLREGAAVELIAPTTGAPAGAAAGTAAGAPPDQAKGRHAPGGRAPKK
jgi:multidrug efflux system membrane fusion protein